MRIKLTILFFLSFIFLNAQNQVSDSITRKTYKIIKTETSPKIDGILDDEVWKNVPLATDFFELQPNNGKDVPKEYQSEVKMVYDDTGIIIAAQLFDSNSSDIRKELSERDNFGNSDFFGVLINGYNDKQQSLGFIVSSSGVQLDQKITNDYGEDSSWNAVWNSAVKINEKGWTVEIKIPFYELRFPQKNIQEWGINFIRHIQKNQTKHVWNKVNNNRGSLMLYDGILTGLENIKTPLRLSFLPYFSSYVNSYNGESRVNFNGGMDLKYGINDAFTLDLTLIPDFGQANFDKLILNLSPFEQMLEENRPFFTEGTELFSKGNLFYSRRIGGSPSKFPDVNANETLLEYPTKVKLFNAVKISGRTNKGLGIGIFNAVTEKMEASVKNTTTGEIRKETVEPWSNYNIFVLDQRFRGNSSVSFINTNATRMGDFRDSNVSAIMVDITNKKNTWNYYGNLKGSFVNELQNKFGSEISGGFGKISGAHRFNAGFFMQTKNWDINDLGYSGGTNFINYNTTYSYRYLKPKGNINQLMYRSSMLLIRRLQTDHFSQFIVNSIIDITNKKFLSYGAGVMMQPFKNYDIYEARTDGRVLQNPRVLNPWIFFGTDENKKFKVGGYSEVYFYDEDGRIKYNAEINTRYRFSDRFSLFYEFEIVKSKAENGFVGKDTNEIYIGKRDRNTFVNEVSSQYIFNEKMSLNLSFRHYFTDVTYQKFYTLNMDGTLNDTQNFTQNKNGTFNTWNLDLRYSWWFAPGSQLTLLYRNSVDNYLEVSKLGFNENFKNLFENPMLNNISLKLTYFLDYNKAKNWLK